MGRKNKAKQFQKAGTVTYDGSSIKAGIHEGARYFSRIDRTSEIVEDFNKNVRCLVTDYDRCQLVNKSRFFVENLPCIRSAVEEIATYSVGDSFNPEFRGTDSNWGKMATIWLRQWLSQIEMNQKLWLASIAIDRDGDILGQRTFASNGEYPWYELIPSDAIGTTDKTITSGPYAGHTVIDGVVIDNRNKPVAYNIKLSSTGSKSVQVPVASGLLISEPRYPGQLRSYPTLASATNDLLDYRDIKDAEREAIKQAASVAFVEKNEVGGVMPNQYGQTATSSFIGPNEKKQPIYWKYYNQGTTRYFGSTDPNSGLEQIENNRPGDQTQAFLSNHILAGVFNSVGWSLPLAFDMAGLNSANTRAILAKAERKLLQRKTTLFKLWNHAVQWGVAQAIQLGLLPYSPEWFRWDCSYPTPPSIDLGRDSVTDSNNLKICATTLTDIFAKQGESFEEKKSQRIKEVKSILTECQKEGVPWQLVYSLYPNMQTPDSGSMQPAQP